MRPYWKGYLKLALVSCPIALHAACSTAERIAFRQINKATGNRLRQQLIDEETRACGSQTSAGKGSPRPRRPADGRELPDERIPRRCRAAPSTPASRPSITSISPSPRWTPSARPVRPISRAKRAKAGGSSATVMTMEPSRGPPWTGRPCSGLLADVRARQVDIVVVYKVDRLTRSLADFAKLIELFEPHRVSFVSVTQSFNTSSSMGRLTLKGEHRSGAELDGLVHVIAGAWGVTLAQQAAAAKHECVHVVRIDLERLAGVRDHAVEIIAPAREDDGALQVRPEEVSALDPLGCDQPSAGFDFRRTDGVAEAFRLIVGPQGRRRGDGRDRQRCWLVGEEVEQSLVNVEAGHGCIVAAPDHTGGPRPAHQRIVSTFRTRLVLASVARRWISAPVPRSR